MRGSSRLTGAVLAAILGSLPAVAPGQPAVAPRQPAVAPQQVGAKDAAATPGTGEIPRHPSLLEFAPRRVTIPAAEPLVHRLSGGTAVVVAEDHTLPLVDLVLALPRERGDRDQPPGLAALTAAMMRRGGTQGHSPGALDAAVDGLGAEMDARATTGRVGASLSSLSATLDEVLGLFFEMLREPAFDAGRVEQARDNLLSSLAARNDDPIEVMERELEWLLFGRRAPRVERLTAADLAALEPPELAAHHRRAWRPERAVIAVSGAVDTERVLPSLAAHISRWSEAMGEEAAVSGDPAGDPAAVPTTGGAPTSGAAATEAPTAQPPTPDPAPAGLYWLAHASDQAKVSLALRLEPMGKWDARRAAALDLTNELLGGTGILSRLGGRLRGREGLVYRVLSEVALDRDEPGLFRIFLDTPPESLGRALDGVVRELERLRAELPAPGELEGVRQELLSRLAQRFDSAEEIAGYFAEDLLVGRPHEYWSQYLEHLSTRNSGDVREVARIHLDPAAFTVVVVGGPADIAELRRVDADHAIVRGWLETARKLPRRDPLTLQVLGEEKPQ